MAIKSRSRSAAISAEDLVALVVTTLDDGKAEDIAIIDLRGKSSMADHLVIATGGSNRHVGALADHTVEALKNVGQKLSVEGVPQCDWVLIDGGDIIVHLFRPEVRTFYNLEKMWGAGVRPELPGRPAGQSAASPPQALA